MLLNKKKINPKIKNIVDIYERSTAPSESNTEATQKEYNPTKEVLQFLIKRNKQDARHLKLTHLKILDVRTITINLVL